MDFSNFTLPSNVTNNVTESFPITGLNQTISSDLPFFGYYFRGLGNAYRPFHGYVCFLVCIIGVTAAIMNIIVLSR